MVLQGILGLTVYTNRDSTNAKIDINAPAFLRLCLDILYTKYDEAELQLNAVKMKAHGANVCSLVNPIFL